MAPSEQGCPGAATISGPGAVVSPRDHREGHGAGTGTLKRVPVRAQLREGRQGQRVSLVCCASSPRTKKSS